MGGLPVEQIAAVLIVLFLGIGFHEYAHAKFADMAGDPTPRYFGRVTLNLTKHFELMGTIMMVVTTLSGFGIGWGKPCPMDPRKMRDPRWDHFVAVLAGPVSNLIQAAIYGTLMRILLGNHMSIGSLQTLPPFLAALLQFGVTVNLSLCFFNLIPLGPLDGHWLVGSFLPDRARAQWYLFNRGAGTMILFGMIFLGQLSQVPILGAILGPPVYAGFKLITGIHY